MCIVIGNLATVIMVAIGDDRVTIVDAALDEIQFIAARRAHFDLPELAVRIEGQPERVAVSERPDLPVYPAVVGKRILARVVDERIVFRDRTIVVQAKYLSEVRLHVLCGRELLALSG